MQILANAKINLSLNVVLKMDNGYHELDMVMMPLALADELELNVHSSNELIIKGSNLVVDEHNTILKAIALMQETYGLREHYQVVLHKRIPMQAGLAGGSADAAAVLRGINELARLHRPLEELAALGKKIGADVPFCVHNTCARVKGIGEQIEPIANTLNMQVLLVKPEQGVSTPLAFQTLDHATLPHPDIDALIEALQNHDENALAKAMGNSLEQSALRLVPEIATIKAELTEMGFVHVLMSGSGSTVFALSHDTELLEKAHKHYKDQGLFSCVSAFV